MVGPPGKRVLVRWNDDHDKELLLWIVFCCTEAGVKIPFDKVAYYMGTNFSEGAIVQHLAKVRTKMVENGLHCPPTQKRGSVVKAPSKLYTRKRVDTAPAPRSVSTLQETSFEEQEDDQSLPQPRSMSVSTTAGPRQQGPALRSRRAKKARDIKEESDLEEDNPDAEYGSKAAREKRPASDVGLSSTNKRPRRTRQQRHDHAGDFDDSEWNVQSQLMQGQKRYSGSQNDQSHQDRWKTGPLPASLCRLPDARHSNIETSSVNSEEEEDESEEVAGEMTLNHGANVQSHSPYASRFAGEYGQAVTHGALQQSLPPPETQHGFGPDLNNWHFGDHPSNVTDFMGPPSQPYAFNPIPRPGYVNPYAPGFSESTSRLQSFASSDSNMSIDNQSLYDHPSKNETSHSTTNRPQLFARDPFESTHGDGTGMFAAGGSTSVSDFFDDAMSSAALDRAYPSADHYGLPPYEPSVSLDFDDC